MKSILLTSIFLVHAVSAQSFACKTTPAGGDALLIGGVVKFVAYQAGTRNYRIINVTNRGSHFLVEVRNERGLSEINQYDVSMATDCRVTVTPSYK